MSVRDHVAIYLRRIPRLRTLGLIAIAGVLCISACTNRSETDLLPEYSVELVLNGTTPPIVSRAVQAGSYLVEVRENEIDVHLTVESGGIRSEIEDRVPRHGAMYQVVSLSAPGELNVTIRSADHRTKQGRANLRIARWRRTPDSRPGELELGFVAFGAAGEQAALATPESWTRAADKLNEAVTRFEAADDDTARAQAAYTLANVQYAARDQWTAAVRATETATEAYKAVDDEQGVQNAAALRAAAEVDLAAAMNAGTQRAEQNALYGIADRRLADAADFFLAHKLPVRAQYAVNMRAVRAVNVGDYAAADKLLSQAIEMARANRDVAEEVKALGNLASLHNFRGFMAQAAQEYEALLPLIDRDSSPYEYAALLGNFGFTL